MPSSGPKASPNPDRRHRRYPRYRTDFPVTISLLAEGEYKTLQGHCRDLSKAGIGILVAAELNGGEVASLNFSLPGNSQPWDVRGVIRHRRGYHYGFEFLTLNTAQKRALDEFLQGCERAD